MITVIFLLFGLMLLALVLIALASLAVSAAAILYRLIPGPNVPLTYNLRNMAVRWMNTVVTAGALTLVVFLLVQMFGVVIGMYRLTQASGRPGNVILLQDGSTDESFSSLPPTADVLRLPEDVRKQILRTGGEYVVAREIYIIVNQPIPNAPPGGKQNRFVQLRGIDKPHLGAKIHGIELQDGRWFSQQGIQAIKASSGSEKKYDENVLVAFAGVAAAASIGEDRAIEVVIGPGLARELGMDRPEGAVKCGEILEVGGRKWIVVGIMSTANSSFASEMWCRDYLAQQLFGRRDSYSSFVVATADAKAAEYVAKELKAFKELAINAMPETEYYASMNAVNHQFLVSFILVAIVLAVAGVLGVMITMFAAISQRAKDIGVLRLLGYTRWQIVVSLLLESLVLALLGGILGCVCAYLVYNGLTVTSIVGSGQGGSGKTVIFKLDIDWLPIAIGMAITLIMGAVGGLIPALLAMRLKPLESLR